MATGRKRTTRTKPIVVEPIPRHSDAGELVNAGIAEFIPNDASLDDFLHTIRSVAK